VFYIMMQRVSERLGKRARLGQPKPSKTSSTPA